MAGGTYTLLVERQSGGSLTVGALGERQLPAGWYAYTGSAQGSGGFARVARHSRLARGEHDATHWHVDHLLGAPDAALVAVTASHDAAVECAVADALSTDEGAAVEPVDGVGCSDCDCSTHLHYAAERAPLLAAVERAHRRATAGIDG